MKKIMINEFGDESKMILNEVDTPSPKDNEVLVQHKAIGINFIDIYQRTGLYPLNLPSSLGLEASGVVEAIGADVKNFKVGDRATIVYGYQVRLLPTAN